MTLCFSTQKLHGIFEGCLLGEASEILMGSNFNTDTTNLCFSLYWGSLRFFLEQPYWVVN